MTEQDTYDINWFRENLDALVQSYQTPPERRVGYGNLRHEYSIWKREGEEVINVAVIYETPGGSTTQLNISHSSATSEFIFLDSNLGEITTYDGRMALHEIASHVETLPRKRHEALTQQVDIWMGQGKSRSEVFAELNKLLQNEFLGGRVTSTELKGAIQYAIKLKKAASG